MKYNDNGLWKTLNVKVTDTLPVGTIIPYAGTTIPSNYMKCEGQALSRIEYDILFSAIGTTYGVGDGTTTFNLPNLKGRIITGVDSNDTDFDVLGETGGEKTHKLTIQEIPSHSHQFLFDQTPGSNIDAVQVGGSSAWLKDTTSRGGDQPHNNLQPYIVLNYIIKVLDAPATGIRSETLPVGSEIDYDGETIPTGWEQVSDKEKLLWTNPNPTQAISQATNITLSSNDYDVLEIFYEHKISNNTSTYSSRMLKNSAGTRLFIPSVDGIVYRVITKNSDTAFTINQITNSDDGELAVPIYIIGYKTELFS